MIGHHWRITLVRIERQRLTVVLGEVGRLDVIALIHRLGEAQQILVQQIGTQPIVICRLCRGKPSDLHLWKHHRTRGTLSGKQGLGAAHRRVLEQMTPQSVCPCQRIGPQLEQRGIRTSRPSSYLQSLLILTLLQ